MFSGGAPKTRTTMMSLRRTCEYQQKGGANDERIKLVHDYLLSIECHETKAQE